MSLKWRSVVAFLLMVAGLVWLLWRGEALARSIPAISIQICAVALMVSARVAFGRRSFHASATPTAGGVVTSGPYRWVRHPIYAAVLYFVWSAAIDVRSPQALAAAAVVTAGAAVRMYAEERLLLRQYPEYAGYRERTARVIPFVL
jgi:protein-S-isoprenylcysteine O-methyltransferase Ste14